MRFEILDLSFLDFGFRSCSRFLGRGLILYALLVVAGLLSNRGNNHMALVFLSACLVLPWLGGQSEALLKTTLLRRQGWGMTVFLMSLAIIVPYLSFLAIIKGYLGAMFLHPPLGKGSYFLAEKALLFAPLALAEEFFFRGYLQETVFSSIWGERACGPMSLKNLVASTLFGLAHGISRLSPLGLFTIFGGLILGWVVERSGKSIWPAVALHAVSNIAIAWFRLIIGLNMPFF